MNRFRWVLLIVLLSGAIFKVVAQTGETVWTSSDLETMRQLPSSAFWDEYGYQRLAHLTDNIGPRPVGSLQAAAALPDW